MKKKNEIKKTTGIWWKKINKWKFKINFSFLLGEISILLQDYWLTANQIQVLSRHVLKSTYFLTTAFLISATNNF